MKEQTPNLPVSNYLLEQLRIEAKRCNMSLKDYVENALLDILYYKPNAETLEAIREAQSGKRMERLDVAHFRDFVNSL